MNSVMSKLFRKDNEHFDSSEIEKCDAHINMRGPSDAVNGMEMEQAEEAPNDDLNDMQMEETEEPSDEDLDDDLVINIAPRKSCKSIMQTKTETMELNKDLQSRKHPRFEETSLPKKRQRFEASSESKKGKQEPTSVISGARKAGKSLPVIQEASQNQHKAPGLAGKTMCEFSSTISRDESRADPQGVDDALTSSATKTETEQNMISTEPKKGVVWTQKASWRDLVRGALSTPFSISQVLPTTNPSPTVVSDVNESRKSAAFLEATTDPLAEQMLSNSMGIPSTGTADGSIGHATGELKENKTAQKMRVVPKITIGEVCPFIRNAESEKQWSKAKKVLSGFNKKSKEGRGSNATKGKPLKRR